MDYLLFIVVGFISAMASAVFGFGTALLFLAAGSHILPVKQAIALATVLFAAATISKTILFRHHIIWRVAGVMALASGPFAYLGAELLAITDAGLIKRLLGLMVLAYLALKHTNQLPTFRIATMGLVAGSAAYGFASGFLGSGNVIKVIMFREMQVGKEAFVGGMAATSVLANTIKLVSYGHSGLLPRDMFWPGLALTLSAIAAAFAGRMVLQKLAMKDFELGVEILLGIAALALLW